MSIQFRCRSCGVFVSESDLNEFGEFDCHDGDGSGPCPVEVAFCGDDVACGVKGLVRPAGEAEDSAP